MANFDNKLGEFFKLVDKSERDLKAKKKGDDTPLEEPAAAAPEIIERVAPAPVEVQSAVEVQSVSVQEQVRQAPASAVATIDPSDILIDDGVIGEPRSIRTEPDRMRIEQLRTENSSPNQPIFEDAEVEDFFSFLNHKSEPETKTPVVEAQTKAPLIDTPPVVKLGHLSEGTGEPRPIVNDTASVVEVAPVIEPEVFEAKPVDVIEPVSVVHAEAAVVREVKPAIEAEAEHDVEAPGLQEKWDRMPHHLQTLFGVARDEVAQNSYKQFKESRSDLIQRLLDPPLTLEEAARILNVCPTTVRRYTNRGVLQHFRTEGNQRRFRLSDVLSFMETGARKGQMASDTVE